MSNIKNAPTLKGQIVVPDVIHGKSAYELAVMNGFDGTEAEWLESLVGIGILRVDNIRAEGANAVFDIVLTDGTVTTVSVPTIYLVNGGIVQYTGDSEAVAMSQKAVTLLFNSLIERLEAVDVLTSPELVGTWKFQHSTLPDYIDLSTIDPGDYPLKFTSNGESYEKIYIRVDNAESGYYAMCYRSKDNSRSTDAYISEIGQWYNGEASKYITIDTAPIVSEEFKTWFLANAKPSQPY